MNRDVPLTKNEVEELLPDVIARVIVLLEKYPDDWMIESIKNQCIFLRDWIAAGSDRQETRLADFTVGFLAGRAVVDVDEEPADCLYDLNWFVENTLNEDHS